MSYANIGNLLTQISIAGVGNVNADGNTTGVDLSGVATANPSAATNYTGQIVFLLDAANTAGTNPTLAIKLQESDNDSDYTDITGGGFTSLTTTASRQKIVLNRNALKRYVRVNYDIGGTSSPNYHVSIQALATLKTPA